MSEEIAGQPGSISAITRVQVAGVVLMGQIVGFLFAALVLSLGLLHRSYLSSELRP